MKLKFFCIFLAVIAVLPLLCATAAAQSVLVFEPFVMIPPCDVVYFNDTECDLYSSEDIGYHYGFFAPIQITSPNTYIVSASFSVTFLDYSPGSVNIPGYAYTDIDSSRENQYIMSDSGAKYSFSGSFGNAWLSYTVIDNVYSFNFYAVVSKAVDIYIPLEFEFSIYDNDYGYLSSGSVIGHDSVIAEVYGSSGSDVINAINAMSSSNNASSAALTTALKKVGAEIVSSTNESNAAIKASVEQLEAAVEEMSSGMSEEFVEGLNKYDEEEEKKLVEELDDNVNEILDQLPLVDQQDNFVNAMDAIVTAFGDESMDCNLLFPAGTVSVSGTTYTFWNEQQVDLNSWLQNDYIQMLLVALRFVFAYSFVMYMFNWIKKIIALIMLDDVSEES